MNVDHLLAAADSLRAMAEQLRALSGTPALPPVTTPARPEFKIEQVAPYVVIKKAAAVTGYSVRAIEVKIERGIWLEGREWIKGPDGRRLISMKGYEAWVMRGKR